MTTVNIHEAKTNLSQLIQKVLQGDRVIIAKAGHPVIELKEYKDKHINRRAGFLKDKIWISEDFDAPIDDFKDYMK